MQIWCKEMNKKFALEILNWRYEKPYDFYNNDVTEEELKELLDGSYSALLNHNNELIGFFCTGASAQVPKGKEAGVYAENLVDIGIGMKPELTGKGNGFSFFSRILALIEEKHPSMPLRLTAADFNQRAIRLYEEMGFAKKNEFSTSFARFITMVKKEV